MWQNILDAQYFVCEKNKTGIVFRYLKPNNLKSPNI